MELRRQQLDSTIVRPSDSQLVLGTDGATLTIRVLIPQVNFAANKVMQIKENEVAGWTEVSGKK